jgi:uncharacterized protein with von Willebrand factor type A (vWA) domain
MNIIRTSPMDVGNWSVALAQSVPLQTTVTQGEQKFPGFHDLVADVFQALYQPAPVFDNQKTITLHEFLLRDIVYTQEFANLAPISQTNLINSAVAANVLAEQILQRMSTSMADRLAEEWRASNALAQAEAEVATLQAAVAANPGDPALQQQLAEAQARLQAAYDELTAQLPIETLQGDTDKMRNTARQASAQAITAVNELIELETVFGTDRAASLQTKLHLQQKIRGNRKMQMLAALAGRMRRIALAKKNSVVRHFKQEIMGVTVGKDLAHVVPAELGLLGNPTTKPLFLKKFHEGQLMVYDQKGEEKLGQGPMVLLVDSTGSMRGEPEVWSKAVVLGFLAIAESEKRDVFVAAFGSSGDDLVTWSFLYKSDPRSVKSSDILGFAEYFMDASGTDLEKPLLWAAKFIAKPDKPQNAADVVMLTDGESRFSGRFLQQWKTLQEATGFHSFGVMIGTSSGMATLRQAIQNVVYVTDLTQDGDVTDVLFKGVVH